MEESFLDNLLNNPADGTFLAWISDGGLWAILIAVGAIIGWWLVRRFLRRGLRQAIRGLDQHDATADVAPRDFDRDRVKQMLAGFRAESQGSVPLSR